jgi:hypothetical protein
MLMEGISIPESVCCHYRLHGYSLLQGEAGYADADEPGWLLSHPCDKEGHTWGTQRVMRT